MKGKGSGWRNESRRHSLARYGIKTANGKLRYNRTTDPEVISASERKGIPPFFRMDIENYNFPFIARIYEDPEYFDRREGKVMDIVMMPVDAYHDAVIMGNNLDGMVFSDEKIKSIKQGIAEGNKFYIPYLEYSTMHYDGKLKPYFGQEGNHRALVSKELGYPYIPVIVVYPSKLKEFEVARDLMTGQVMLSIDMNKVRTDEERREQFEQKYGRTWNL